MQYGRESMENKEAHIKGSTAPDVIAYHYENRHKRS